MSHAGGEVVFGSRDARVQYGGKGVSGVSKNGAKGKAAKQISVNFDTPMVPRPSFKGSASDSDTKQSVKGEKSKKKVLSPPSTSSGAGAVGGRNGGESSTDDNEAKDDGFSFPKNKLGELCRHLGKGRGECVNCILLLC